MLRQNIIKIDSSKAQSYFNNAKTSFIYQFDNIDCENDQSMLFSVNTISIPYSFYSCNQHNNVMTLKHNNNSITMIEIPEGNYNVYEYMNVVQTLMSVNGLVFTITYNHINNKYIFTSNQNLTIQYKTGVQKNTNFLFLGFPEDEDIIFLVNQQVQSDNTITMNDIQYIQILSDLGSDNYRCADNGDNVLQIIPINVPPFSMINMNVESKKFILSSKNLQEINLKLVDNQYRSLDLNGLSFLITITIDIVDNDSHKIPYSKGRQESQEGRRKTNLEMIQEDPTIIKTAPQMDLTLFNEYNRINKMIEENNRETNEKKRKTIPDYRKIKKLL